MIELKELTEKTLEIFDCQSVEDLGDDLMKSLENESKLQAFCDLVDNDLTKDWLQMIFQYYLADRKEKKQDYTPASLAYFMGVLAGDSEEVIDMCAGSGALIIQKWVHNPETKFTAIEIDNNVIPFLIFNMVLRNIFCRIYQMNALSDDKPINAWKIEKGEHFGKIVNSQSTL